MLRMCSNLRTSATLRGGLALTNDCPLINLTQSYCGEQLFCSQGWGYVVPHDHLRRDSRMSAASTAEGHQLFRPEALEAQRQALLGRILINTPLARWLVAATPAALVAALFTFLWFARYTPHIRAQGVFSLQFRIAS